MHTNIEKPIPGIPGVPNIPDIIDSYTTETQKELGPRPKYKKGIQKNQVPIIDHNKRKKRKYIPELQILLMLITDPHQKFRITTIHDAYHRSTPPTKKQIDLAPVMDLALNYKKKQEYRNTWCIV